MLRIFSSPLGAGLLGGLWLTSSSAALAQQPMPESVANVHVIPVQQKSAEPIVDYATFKANQDAELTDLAWLYSMNRGIFMTPGREEEWTLTVAHDDAAIDRYVAVFAELGDELTA